MQIKKENISYNILLLPWILTLIIFWLYPLIYSLFLSFNNYHTLTNTMQWSGLTNYIKLLKDEIFIKSLINTIIFTIGTVPITNFLAIVLAVAINSKLARFKNLYKVSFFIPSVTSLVVISLIFTNLYGRDGIINNLLSTFGFPIAKNGFLLSTTTSLPAIMVMDIWVSVGYYVVIYLAGLQTISDDLYEAASLSGASGFQKFWKITMPLLKPTILFALVINTIKSFQIFVEIFVMTKGGPLDSTTTVIFMVFQNAFEKPDMMGYSSAIAYILFVILIILSVLQIRLLRTK